MKKFSKKNPLRFSLIISLNCIFAIAVLSGCATPVSHYKYGTVKASDITLKEAKQINGVSVPANTSLFGVTVHEVPHLSVPFEYQWTEVYGRVVLAKKFGDNNFYYGLMPKVDAKDMSGFVLKRSSYIYKKDSSGYFLNPFTVFSSRRVLGENIETGIVAIENTIAKTADIFYFRNSEIEQLKGNWKQRKGHHKWGFHSKISDDDDFYRIYRNDKGTIEPYEGSPSDLIGYFPLDEENDEFKDLIWIGEYETPDKNKEYTVHGFDGVQLSVSRFTDIMVKPHELWATFKKDPFVLYSLIAKTKDGKYEVFAPDFGEFDYFNYVKKSDSTTEEEAIKFAESDFAAANKVAKENIAAREKALVERAASEKVALQNIELALQLNPAHNEMTKASLETWKSVHRNCKVFHNYDQKRPIVCKDAYRRVEKIQNALASADAAVRKQKEDEWKASQLQWSREKAEWDKQQSQRSNSGSSQMIHNQMLRNGYQWVRRRR